MEFKCVKFVQIEDGRFWVEGETYLWTRKDVRALADILDHFEPANQAARDYMEARKHV